MYVYNIYFYKFRAHCFLLTTNYLHDWCFMPRFCTVRLYWDGDNLCEWSNYLLLPPIDGISECKHSSKNTWHQNIKCNKQHTDWPGDRLFFPDRRIKTWFVWKLGTQWRLGGKSFAEISSQHLQKHGGIIISLLAGVNWVCRLGCCTKDRFRKDVASDKTGWASVVQW